jgi:hypothetical protein
MNSKLSLILLIAACLGGCASKGTAPSELVAATSKDEFRLSSPLQYTFANVERGVLPGMFRADKSDSAGTYYVCEDRCVWDRQRAGGPTYLYPGGVYIPSDNVKAPRLFRIFTESEQTTDDLNAYIQNRTTTSVVQGGPVGASAVGGAIAGAIVQAAISASVGRYHAFELSPDTAFLTSLSAAIATRRPMQSSPGAAKTQ